MSPHTRTSRAAEAVVGTKPPPASSVIPIVRPGPRAVAANPGRSGPPELSRLFQAAGDGRQPATGGIRRREAAGVGEAARDGRPTRAKMSDTRGTTITRARSRRDGAASPSRRPSIDENGYRRPDVRARRRARGRQPPGPLLVPVRRVGGNLSARRPSQRLWALPAHPGSWTVPVASTAGHAAQDNRRGEMCQRSGQIAVWRQRGRNSTRSPHSRASRQPAIVRGSVESGYLRGRQGIAQPRLHAVRPTTSGRSVVWWQFGQVAAK